MLVDFDLRRHLPAQVFHRCDVRRLVNVSLTFITNAAGVTRWLRFVFKELVASVFDGVRLRDRSIADVYLKHGGLGACS